MKAGDGMNRFLSKQAGNLEEAVREKESVGKRVNNVIDKRVREMENKENNRFLNKQANEEEELREQKDVPLAVASYGGAFAGGALGSRRNIPLAVAGTAAGYVGGAAATGATRATKRFFFDNNQATPETQLAKQGNYVGVRPDGTEIDLAPDSDIVTSHNNLSAKEKVWRDNLSTGRKLHRQNENTRQAGAVSGVLGGGMLGAAVPLLLSRGKSSMAKSVSANAEPAVLGGTVAGALGGGTVLNNHFARKGKEKSEAHFNEKVSPAHEEAKGAMSDFQGKMQGEGYSYLGMKQAFSDMRNEMQKIADYWDPIYGIKDEGPLADSRVELETIDPDGHGYDLAMDYLNATGSASGVNDAQEEKEELMAKNEALTGNAAFAGNAIGTLGTMPAAIKGGNALERVLERRNKMNPVGRGVAGFLATVAPAYAMGTIGHYAGGAIGNRVGENRAERFEQERMQPAKAAHQQNIEAYNKTLKDSGYTGVYDSGTNKVAEANDITNRFLSKQANEDKDKNFAVGTAAGIGAGAGAGAVIAKKRAAGPLSEKIKGQVDAKYQPKIERAISDYGHQYGAITDLKEKRRARGIGTGDLDLEDARALERPRKLMAEHEEAVKGVKGSKEYASEMKKRKGRGALVGGGAAGAAAYGAKKLYDNHQDKQAFTEIRESMEKIARYYN